jgi:hypothetical protein
MSVFIIVQMFSFSSLFTTKSNSEDYEEIFLRCLLFDNELFKIYQTSSRDFVNNIKMWACQRDLNISHVKNLEQSIVERGYLLGTFKVIRDKNGKTRLIDGQHRVTALQNIMDNDSKFDCDSIIELYEVESFEDEEATKLFLDANNTLNITKKDMNLDVQNVLRHFVKEYPLIFVDVKEGARCNRPRINKRIFVGKLRDLVIHYEPEKIINTITDYNKKVGRLSKEVLIRKCGTYSDRMYDIAKENGCYLGLIPDCNWIDDLDFL